MNVTKATQDALEALEHVAQHCVTPSLAARARRAADALQEALKKGHLELSYREDGPVWVCGSCGSIAGAASSPPHYKLGKAHGEVVSVRDSNCRCGHEYVLHCKSGPNGYLTHCSGCDCTTFEALDD